MFWIIVTFFVVLISLVVSMKFLMQYIAANGVGKARSTDANNPLLKKFSHISLEKFAGLFLNIGLVFSLAFVLWAFEYKDYDDSELVDLGQLDDNFEEIMEIPPTEIPPPPPPKIEIPKIIEIPDEEEIEEEIEIELDVEVTEDAVIEDIILEEAPEEEEVDEIFDIVEESAAPPGGLPAFYKYVSNEMKYPKTARRMGISGRVFVRFVIDETGKITNVEAVKGIGGGCDEEAVRVIQSSKKWSPGKQRGRPVKQRMILPITFRLQ